MYKIRFGTDGWRAIIAKEYTVDNVRRIAAGTLAWLKSKNFKRVVIGYDCRYGGNMFQQEVATILSQDGIECLVSKEFVSTPMVSLGVLHHKAQLGIVLTASHNPPSYNGYKLKSSYGGPSSPSEIAEVESMIPEYNPELRTSFEELLKKGIIRYVNLEQAYTDHIKSCFKLSQIQTTSRIAYDAMYGAGQRAMQQLFPELVAFHCDHNPGFHDTPPEPILKNLGEIQSFMQANPGEYIGIATDGDADRLAMLDGHGKIVDSQHLLLLLLHYLAGFKKLSGKIVVSFSVTNKLKKLAQYYGLEVIITRIGFKYIAEYMISDDVLVGGEESGGLAIKGHIPERDGIWIALTILEFMGITRKTIQQLIDEVYSLVGAFCYDRLDLHLNDEQIDRIKMKLQSTITSWSTFQVIETDDLDGRKYYFENDSWLLIRTSGTEPVLRIYAQGQDAMEVEAIFNAAREVLQV